MEHPNGAWIWQLDKIRRDYIGKLKAVNCHRVYLKVIDGSNFWNDQCTPEIVREFQQSGIQVWGWGYHYGRDNVKAQVSALKQAMNCGLEGYIFDLESEVKDPSTHVHVKQLLEEARGIIPKGKMGYTSFGHPGFHREIPWKLLDSICDLAFPQMYFEKWSFSSSDESEVQMALDAHRELGLTKPILPIWGSESDTSQPATAAKLQRMLNRFEGSSIWRIPHRDEAGEAWNLDYRGRGGSFVPIRRESATETIGRILQVARGWVHKSFKPGEAAQCAVFVRSVFAEAGITLARASRPSDWDLTNHLPQGAAFANSLAGDEVGSRIEEPQSLLPGDIVLFRNTFGDWPDGVITHVGIYSGNGNMIDRPTSDRPVSERSMLDSFWRPRFVEGRRVVRSEVPVANSAHEEPDTTDLNRRSWLLISPTDAWRTPIAVEPQSFGALEQIAGNHGWAFVVKEEQKKVYMGPRRNRPIQLDEAVHSLGDDDYAVEPTEPGNPYYAQDFSKRGGLLPLTEETLRRKLSTHFTVSEFICKGPNFQEYVRIHPELVKLLEKIRSEVGGPVHISSAYRPRPYNARIGGAQMSQHIAGTAADIYTDQVSNADLHKICDKVVGKAGGVGQYRTFVHVDVRGVRERWRPMKLDTRSPL